MRAAGFPQGLGAESTHCAPPTRTPRLFGTEFPILAAAGAG